MQKFAELADRTESIISTLDEDVRIQWLSTKVSCSVGVILLSVGTIFSLVVGTTTGAAMIFFFSMSFFIMSFIVGMVTLLCMPKKSTDMLLTKLKRMRS